MTDPSAREALARRLSRALAKVPTVAASVDDEGVVTLTVDGSEALRWRCVLGPVGDCDAVSWQGRSLAVAVPDSTAGMSDPDGCPCAVVAVELGGGHGAWAPLAHFQNGARRVSGLWVLPAVDGLRDEGVGRMIVWALGRAMSERMAGWRAAGGDGARASVLFARMLDHGDTLTGEMAEWLRAELPPGIAGLLEAGGGALALPLTRAEWTVALAVEGTRRRVLLPPRMLRTERMGRLATRWVDASAEGVLSVTVTASQWDDGPTLAVDLSLRAGRWPVEALAGAVRALDALGNGAVLTFASVDPAGAMAVRCAVPPGQSPLVEPALVSLVDDLARIAAATGDGLWLDLTRPPTPEELSTLAEALRVMDAGVRHGNAPRAEIGLDADGVRSLLEAARGQRRLRFGLPPRTAVAQLFGTTVTLGPCETVVRGTLEAPPEALAERAAALSPGETVNVALVDVELEERFTKWA